jgi:hypothetical protein
MHTVKHKSFTSVVHSMCQPWNGKYIFIRKVLVTYFYLFFFQNCVPEQKCKCQDSKNNTFMCVRHLEPHVRSDVIPSHDFVFCKFMDSEVSL